MGPPLIPSRRRGSTLEPANLASPFGYGWFRWGINSTGPNPPRRLRLLFLALGAAVVARAATPFLERNDLFAEHTDGFVSYRIPGVVVTAPGTVLAYCEARKFSGADWGEIEIHLRRSADGGRTFAPARQIAHLGPRLPRHPVLAEHPSGKHGGPDEQTVNNPVAIATREGPVHLLYCVEYQRAFHVRSDDDGLTWSAPVEITGAFAGFRPAWPWRVLALGPGHGLQLQSGRLVVPVWIALAEGSPHGGGVSATIFSDDGGRTWRAGAIAVPNDARTPGPSEAIATELPGGRVLLLTRTRSPGHRKVATISPDGAGGWSTPQLVPDLVEPICMSGLLTLPDAVGRPSAYLVHSNPDHLGVAGRDPRPGDRRDRRNLTIKLSRDGGATWPVSRVLEPGPSAYSDLAVLPDGTIVCFYERGRPGALRPGSRREDWPYARLTLARFNRTWLESGHP